jgi:hypothetical protein
VAGGVVGTTVAGEGDALGEEAAPGEGLVDGVALADGVGVAAAAVIVVLIDVRQVSTAPPALPVPLHWLTEIGMTGLTVDAGSTEQLTVPPPPFAEPLHCVTVALVVVAGNGAQVLLPPPPPADPTHWLTVAAVTGSAPGVSALMLLVMLTSQLIGWAASLSEPLHWLIEVTRSLELVVVEPLPGAHGSREHCRLTVVVDEVVPPLMVLMTVTEQVMPVVAPMGPGPTLLHWSTVSVAACAGAERLMAPNEKLVRRSKNAASAGRHSRRIDVAGEVALLSMACSVR